MYMNACFVYPVFWLRIFQELITHLNRPTKSTGPWDRRSQKKIDPCRKFSKLKLKKKKKKKKKNYKKIKNLLLV